MNSSHSSRQPEPAHHKIQPLLEAIEATSDGIAILQNSRLTYLNQAHAELFGYDHVDDLIGHTWTILYAPEEAQRIEQDIFPILEQQRYWHGEAIARRQDGSTFFEELSLTLVDDSMICVCRDITLRKQAEQQLHLALEREKELNVLQSRFTTMMSHEIRTPLAVISSSVGVLQDYGDRLDASKKQQHFQRVQAALQRITVLLEDAALMEKTELQQLECQPVPLQLQQFCQALIHEIQPASIPSRIQMTVAAAADLPSTFNVASDPPVSLDPELLHHIIVRLLRYALKHSLPDISVNLLIEYQPAAIAFRIEHWDAGLSASQVQQMLTARSDPGDIDHTASIDLGLSIVKNCVELHSGTITASSQSEAGTYFSVSVPLLNPTDISHG
jgi:PAS domain S-box-containing protein